MPHEHRFYLSPEALVEGPATLAGHEAHHALHVVRVRPGDAVRVFDGAGRDATATVTSVSRREVELAVGPVTAQPAPAHRFVLVQAVLQREKAMEQVVARATELGVSELRLFQAAHGERPRVKPEKWPRTALESCKQCGRVRLPVFTLHECLEAALTGVPAPLLMASLGQAPVPLRAAVSGQAATLLVGPEGDFSEEERTAAGRAGAVAVSLGPHTLRAEVAAAVGSALVLYELGALGPGPVADS
jgi:16S rRNA (uracil1498-N3)-methyltransferase